MNKINWKSSLKFIIPIIAFIFIAYAYAPQVLQGKIVNQSDISSWQGMANEIVTYNNSHPNDHTLWTNSMFSGMPATTISVIYKGDFTQYVYDLFFVGQRPASYLLISLIGAFLLMLSFGANVYLAFFGAIAISFCSYNMQIIQVGHNSKMVAIAFMPWVLASIVYAYRKCALWGALFFAFALSFQIKANHPQITYYLAMIIVGYGIWQLCAAIKDKTLPKFIRTSVIVLVAGLMGIATNINHLWPTYEYAQHTMRGGSELSENTAAANNNELPQGKKSRKGLDLDYATQWSYGIEETINLMIPNFNGGASSGELSKSSNTYKALKSGGYQGADQIVKQMPLYWGPQPFTAGPMYMGAISIFLFILGFFIVKGGLRWWIGGVCALALMLGWGYHLMPISEFFFNCAPMYNKFRTVSMILVILQILIPIMAVITANGVLFADNKSIAINENKEKVKKGFIWALALTAGISLVFAIIPSLAGNFASASDGQLPGEIASALAQDRISLLRTDAWRSIIFVLLSAAALWLGYIKKIKPLVASIALICLLTIDLWTVDKRYLNDSHFVTKKEFTNAFNLRPVDNEILKDKDPNYRVLDLSVNTFNDAYVSYHHKTIGGYSPAKLQRYQDLIEHNISSEMNDIAREMSNVSTIDQAQQALGYHPVLSMLNAKYIVLNANVPPLVNKYALSNAWFANSVVAANNANDEMDKLSQINPAVEAVVSKDFINSNADLENIIPQLNNNDGIMDMSLNNYIKLQSYAPNKLVYEYSSNKPQLVLYSEVYYNPGWQAKIIPANSKDKSEGKALDIFRANYILRATVVPAGDYTIEFTFNPPCFEKGALYSKISSGLLFILLLGSLLVMLYKFYMKKENKDGK